MIQSNKDCCDQGGSAVVRFLMRIKRLFAKVFGLVLDSEILHILRPFVYVFLVMKHGKGSWVPFNVSLAMDVLIIFLVFLKLIGMQKLRTIEKRDLSRRSMWSLLKYLIRDPVYENFTLPFIRRLFAICRLPEALYGIVLSILNYYRYYTYIA